MSRPEKQQPEICEWTVSGMDCGACVSKIKTALGRMPGVADVQLALMAERLRLQLDGTATSRVDVENLVRGLGYGLSPRDRGGDPMPGGMAAGDNSPYHEDVASQRWYHGAKGRLVIVTALALAGAWVVQAFSSDAFGSLAFVLACLIGIVPIAGRALAALRVGQPFTIESLMTIAAIGALFIDAAEEAAMVVFLFAVGELLEGVAAGKARDGIRALADLVPRVAILLDDEGRSQDVPAAALRPGQRVLVRPGDRIPADGQIVLGTSGVDESPVTGESMPRTRAPGDRVFAGAINREAVLHVQVTQEPRDNTISRIIRLVEEAEEARAPTERFIDRFSRWYMPAVVAIAVLVGLLPPLVMGQDWSVWIYRGLALLLIGCPCALVISVPASIASALSAGARRGLLLKGGAVIEAAAKLHKVAFDKTGTLTRGQPAVTDVIAPAGLVEADMLALAAAVESGSSHPLAVAILTRAAQGAIPVLAADAARALPGQGVQAQVGGAQVFVVSPRFAVEKGALTGAMLQRCHALEAEGKTVVAVFRQGEPAGLVALRDEPRPDAAAAVDQLRHMGIGAVILTGDNPRTAAAIAAHLGTDFHAAMMPEDKLLMIRKMALDGGVMMVGDGINDAPALKQANIGVAMGSGTDVALETADAALLRDRVTDVAALIRLARRTMGNIHQNVSIALGLKALFLVTTVIGATGLWMAILADTGATVLVTLNALRLLAYDPERI